MKDFTEFFRERKDSIKKDLKKFGGKFSQRGLSKRLAQEYESEGLTEVNAYKWISRIANDYIFKTSDHDALVAECESVGIPPEEVNYYWYKGEKFSINVKPKVLSYHEIREDLIKDMSEAAPVYPEIEYKLQPDPYLLVLDPADIHIGKLSSSFETGEEYNQQIAVQRVKAGVDGILQRVTNSFPIDQILFVIGNDVLHTDNPRRTTTSGTPQDTDGMWYDNFRMAKQLYIDTILKLVQVAPVHVVFNPSNHDYTNGFFLADSIFSWFAKHENVTFDVSIAHRKYFRYGENLIGTTHGDGAKAKDLPDIMKVEAKQLYAKSKFCYWYQHHIHHKDRRFNIGKQSVTAEKDFMDVSVIATGLDIDRSSHTEIEYLRSPSGTDSWHSRNGYANNPKAIEAFIHSKQFGQIARITHLF